MKNWKIYYLRFKSETPKVLKRLQVLFGAIGAGTLAAMAIINQFSYESPTVKEWLIRISVFCVGAAASLKFATTSKDIQSLSDKETGLPKS